MKAKALLALLLALCLCLTPVSVCAAEESEEAEEEYIFPGLGEPMPDFTFTDINGTEHTLSETLKEKKMVLLNIWATWCGPCEREFPYMEEAYEQYKDDIEIFALSIEETDTDEVLADYADEHGMTFPIGHALPGMEIVYMTDGIPGSFIIDRFGNLCLYECGYQDSVDSFARAFDLYVTDDYEQSCLMDGFPPVPPEDMQFPDAADIAAALLAEDAGDIAVSYPEDDFIWPMTPAEDAGRACVTGSNTGVHKTYSAVELTFTAEEGDALAFDYRVSCEDYYDGLRVRLDGEDVVVLSGERDWQTYAFALPEGEHTVLLRYEKDPEQSVGEDTAWVSGVRLVSGEAAQQAFDAMPVYPHGEETAVAVINEDAREILFDPALTDDDSVKCYIVPSGQAQFAITLAEDADPYDTTLYRDYDSSCTVLANAATESDYRTDSSVDSIETTGYSYTDVTIESGEFYMDVLLFASEENANTFLDEMELDGWTYADGSAPSTDKRAGEDAAEGELADSGLRDYSLIFVDENDDPVEGVIANVCDDETCTPMTTGENGIIEFTYPGFAYHVQVIKVPDGFVKPTEEVYLDEDGDLQIFTLEKAE